MKLENIKEASKKIEELKIIKGKLDQVEHFVIVGIKLENGESLGSLFSKSTEELFRTFSDQAINFYREKINTLNKELEEL